MALQELSDQSSPQDPEVIEINLLFEGIYQRYGYDFRDYGKAHAKRRIMHRLALSGIGSVSELQHRMLYDEAFFHVLLQDLSINTTEMFRDPEFFQAVREQIIPVLKTYPFIKIWHAGCSTGEEVYSMAILLKEEGLLNRTQIYATDFNPSVLQKAREAIYSVAQMKEYTRNYMKSGGKYSFSDYYNARYDSAILKKTLKENVVFADHNLVTDSVFGEMNLIMCRNTLIYFNKNLQDKVVGLFRDSLVAGGFLCLGSKENITFSPHKENFESVVAKWKIFRKKY